MLADFVNVRGGGLLALGGRSALTEGGYRGTPFAEVLPIALDRAPRDTGGAPLNYKLTPTTAGRPSRRSSSPRATTRRWPSGLRSRRSPR